MTTTFLVIGLLFPRIALLAYYIGGMLPPNSTPFALDVFASLSAPRLLIAWWCWESEAAGVHPAWKFLYVAVWAAGGMSGARSNSHRKETT